MADNRTCIRRWHSDVKETPISLDYAAGAVHRANEMPLKEAERMLRCGHELTTRVASYRMLAPESR